MFRSIYYAILLTLVSFTAIGASQPAKAVATEQPIETTTSALNLPNRLPGSIVLRACNDGCPATSLQLVAESRFFMGSKLISFDELRALTAKSTQNAVVFFEPASKSITRVVVTGNAR